MNIYNISVSFKTQKQGAKAIKIFYMKHRCHLDLNNYGNEFVFKNLRKCDYDKILKTIQDIKIKTKSTRLTSQTILSHKILEDGRRETY